MVDAMILGPVRPLAIVVGIVGEPEEKVAEAAKREKRLAMIGKVRLLGPLALDLERLREGATSSTPTLAFRAAQRGSRMLVQQGRAGSRCRRSCRRQVAAAQ
jgi:hypothetical protein